MKQTTFLRSLLTQKRVLAD